MATTYTANASGNWRAAIWSKSGDATANTYPQLSTDVVNLNGKTITQTSVQPITCYNIIGASGSLAITANVTCTTIGAGTGTATLTITGGSVGTPIVITGNILGNALSSAHYLTVTAGSYVEFHSNVTAGTGSSTVLRGSVYNLGTITAFYGNVAGSAARLCWGIYNKGTITLFSGNVTGSTSTGQASGGIYNDTTGIIGSGTGTITAGDTANGNSPALDNWGLITSWTGDVAAGINTGGQGLTNEVGGVITTFRGNVTGGSIGARGVFTTLNLSIGIANYGTITTGYGNVTGGANGAGNGSDAGPFGIYQSGSIGTWYGNVSGGSGAGACGLFLCGTASVGAWYGNVVGGSGAYAHGVNCLQGIIGSWYGDALVTAATNTTSSAVYMWWGYGTIGKWVGNVIGSTSGCTVVYLYMCSVGVWYGNVVVSNGCIGVYSTGGSPVQVWCGNIYAASAGVGISFDLNYSTDTIYCFYGNIFASDSGSIGILNALVWGYGDIMAVNGGKGFHVVGRVYGWYGDVYADATSTGVFRDVSTGTISAWTTSKDCSAYFTNYSGATINAAALLTAKTTAWAVCTLGGDAHALSAYTTNPCPIQGTLVASTVAAKIPLPNGNNVLVDPTAVLLGAAGYPVGNRTDCDSAKALTTAHYGANGTSITGSYVPPVSSVSRRKRGALR